MSDTFARTLHTDPKVAKAKQLLLDAVKERQQQIREIKPPDPQLKHTYADTLAKFADLRGSSLWYPYIGSGIGNGALVELMDGSVKYDFICGIGVHYWGHSHPDILSAAIDAAISDIPMQGNLQQNSIAVEVADILVKSSGMQHCFFSTSGVMANENALKIAFQKHFPADRVLAFENNFSGRSYAFSQISDKPALRDGLPTNMKVDYLPFYDEQDPNGSLESALRALDKLLKRYPKQYAMLIFEPVQGEGGAYPGSKEFFLPLLKKLKEEGIAVIADEVQTFGRTSELFAFQHFELEEYVDIVTIGKLAQVCATLFRDEYNPRPGLIAQTFTSSTSAFFASKVILEGLIQGGYLGPEGKIVRTHAYFEDRLKEIAKRNPDLITGPYGIGSMVAFTPFGGDAAKVKRYSQELFEAGVISFIAGKDPTRIRFLIPIGTITETDIDTVCEIIETTLKA